MILSYDTILRPPYELNQTILRYVASISEKIGEVNASFIVKASPELRKRNNIRTIQSSLQIEGNTLSEQEITAILDDKRVLGPKQDILEVENAIRVYDRLNEFKFDSVQSFLKAHKLLMHGLVERPGAFRGKGVGVMKGSQIKHVAPPAGNVKFLMNDLFNYLKYDDELALVKSCVFHYETEFIHPFDDGNGRMGRLWQTLILMSEQPLFQHVPFETLIAKTQDDYYKTLSVCDKAGKSDAFIEYMLSILDEALRDLLSVSRPITMDQQRRLSHFCSLNKSPFTRKDYMHVFKNLSSASASRDLKAGVESGLFTKSGDKNSTIYRLTN